MGVLPGVEEKSVDVFVPLSPRITSDTPLPCTLVSWTLAFIVRVLPTRKFVSGFRPYDAVSVMANAVIPIVYEVDLDDTPINPVVPMDEVVPKLVLVKVCR